MQNEQPPLQQRPFDGTYLVHSIFQTIQGEGPFSGDAAVFIRLEGCNLQCDFCDTSYTGGPRAEVLTAPELTRKIIDLTIKNATNLVVLTGGEPFRQDLFALVDALLEQGFNVQIETNGTLAPSEVFTVAFETTWLKERKGSVAIIVSPKAQFVNKWLSQQSIAYKYVLSHNSIDPRDGLPINVLGRHSLPVARPPHDGIQVYIQPADMQDEDINKMNHAAVIASAIAYGHRAQLQIHKHFEVE